MVYNREARARKAAATQAREEQKARFVANIRAQVAKEFNGQISKLKEENQALASRCKTLQEELEAAAENYDSLVGVNENLQAALVQAEREARLARAEADSPSAVKAIQEVLDGEKEKNAKLTEHVEKLKSSLRHARGRLKTVREDYEALIEGPNDGTVAVISSEGVELRGPFISATVEDVAHTLNLAFKLFVEEGSNANIRAALA